MQGGKKAHATCCFHVIKPLKCISFVGPQPCVSSNKVVALSPPSGVRAEAERGGWRDVGVGWLGVKRAAFALNASRHNRGLMGPRQSSFHL